MPIGISCTGQGAGSFSGSGGRGQGRHLAAVVRAGREALPELLAELVVHNGVDHRVEAGGGEGEALWDTKVVVVRGGGGGGGERSSVFSGSKYVAYTRACTHARTHTDAHTRTRTHARTHARIRTHASAHTSIPIIQNLIYQQ